MLALNPALRFIKSSLVHMALVPGLPRETLSVLGNMNGDMRPMCPEHGLTLCSALRVVFRVSFMLRGK